MRYLPIEWLLVFLPMLIGIALAGTSCTVKKIKHNVALWIGWHFYHEDWSNGLPNK